jgi:hypothetical protein
MSEPGSPGTSDRGSNGRFVAGNTASVGHSSAQKRLRAELYEAALEKPGLVKAILIRMAKKALEGEGDVAAARLLLEYLCGKPPLAVELGGPDGTALDLSAVVATILLVLKDEPAARVKVAAAFRMIGESSGDGDDGDESAGGPADGPRDFQGV